MSGDIHSAAFYFVLRRRRPRRGHVQMFCLRDARKEEKEKGSEWPNQGCQVREIKKKGAGGGGGGGGRAEHAAAALRRAPYCLAQGPPELLFVLVYTRPVRCVA